jgi:hypothetical protein
VKTAEDIVNIIRSLFQHFSRLGKYDEMLTDTEKSFIHDKEIAIRNILHSDLESYFIPVLQQDKLNEVLADLRHQIGEISATYHKMADRRNIELA